MTVEERLRKTLKEVEAYLAAADAQSQGSVTLWKADVRELLAELTAKDAQIAKLRAVAEAAKAGLPVFDACYPINEDDVTCGDQERAIANLSATNGPPYHPMPAAADVTLPSAAQGYLEPVETPDGEHVGWSRVAPSPCQRCVELERELEDFKGKAGEDSEYVQRNWASPFVKHGMERRIADLQATVKRLEGELAEANEWRTRHSDDAASRGAQSQRNWERAKAAEEQLAALTAQHAALVKRAEDWLKRWNCLTDGLVNKIKHRELGTPTAASILEVCTYRDVLRDMSKLADASPAAVETTDAPSLDKIKQQVARLQRGCSCVYDDRCASCDAIVALQAMFADTKGEQP